MYRILLAITCIFLAIAPAFAGELGKTNFKGKTVILNDDYTWSYDESSAAETSDDGCITSKNIPPLGFCVPETSWKVMTKPSPAYEFSFSNLNASLFMGLVTEGLSLPIDTYKKAIITFTENAVGGKENVEFLKDEKVEIDGETWGYLEYKVVIQGMTFQYANYYKDVGDIGTAQIVFYTLDTVFESKRQEIQNVVNTINIKL